MECELILTKALNRHLHQCHILPSRGKLLLVEGLVIRRKVSAKYLSQIKYYIRIAYWYWNDFVLQLHKILKYFLVPSGANTIGTSSIGGILHSLELEW